MRRISELLRLKYEAKLSTRAIAQAVGISKGAVSDYLNRAKLAEVNSPSPGEFGDADELARCLDDLHVDGVCLHSNSDGLYLADRAFDPLWAELDRRQATVFVHPTRPPGVKVLPGQPSL